MDYKNHKYNNCAIQVKDAEHGKEVIKWWQDQGVDTHSLIGSSSKYYYGLFDGVFKDKQKELVASYVKIIELPTKYPKVMWVSDTERHFTQKRVVFMEKNGHFLAWNAAESIEEAKEKVEVFTWKYAKDIEVEKIEEVVELTIEDISNGKGVGIAPHLIRIKK